MPVPKVWNGSLIINLFQMDTSEEVVTNEKISLFAWPLAS